MKYLFFAFGLILVVFATILATNGALEGWDANIATLPAVAGVVLIAATFVFHGVDLDG